MVNEVPPLEGKKLLKHVQRCVEAAQDNKYTIKNAFDVHVIDHMVALARMEPDEDDGTSFPLVSMCLHASAKLYGRRVDAVEEKTFRLLDNFGQREKRRAPDESNSFGKLQKGVAEERKQIRRRRLLSSYIAEDRAIECPVDIDHALDRNVVFAHVHDNYGNALGRLMSYNLIPSEIGAVDCEMNASCWAKGSFHRVSTKRRLVIKKDLPLLKPLKSIDMNADESIEFPGDDSTLIPPSEGIIGEDAFVFDLNAEPMPFGGYDDLSNIEPVKSQCPFTSEADGSRISAPGDLSMIYEEVLKSSGLNFAGPSHFRLKRYNILGDEVRSAGQRGPLRGKTEVEYLPLGDAKRLRLVDDVKPDQLYHTAVAPSALEGWSDEKTVYHVESAPSSFAKLTELFSYPGESIAHDTDKATDDEGEDRPFVFNGDADDRPPSPSADDRPPSPFADDQLTKGNHDAVRVKCERDLSSVQTTEATCLVPPCCQSSEDSKYETLVTAPGIIAEKDSLTYTKAAKKFNMRQMRKSFWKVLTNDEGSEKMRGSKTFSELYGEALQHLSAMNQKNISVPIGFVAALTMCNEKHLELTMCENSMDFSLSQAPNPYENEVNLKDR